LTTHPGSTSPASPPPSARALPIFRSRQYGQRRSKGLTVSCDYNYRKKLWKYGKAAPEVMSELVRYVDVGIANEEDCQRSLGIRVTAGAWEREIETGELDPGKYRALCVEGIRKPSPT